MKVFLKSVGLPGFVIALMKWLPVWRKITSVAHTLPHDGAIVKEFQIGEPLPKKRWANVSVPAIVLDGGKSPAWMRSGTRSLATVLSNAQYRTLEGQTHDVNAKVLAPILKKFFGSPRDD